VSRSGRDPKTSERDLSRLFAALSDPERQEILELLGDHRQTITEIVRDLDLPPGAVSRHLSVLKDADLVCEGPGTDTTTYWLNSEALSSSIHAFLVRFPSATAPASIALQELHDPRTGRLDAARLAEYLRIPLRKLAEAMKRNYSAVHKTPTSPTLQPFLRSLKRSLEILEELYPERAAALAWLNGPLPDLGGRAPLDVILEGYPEAVEDMLEGALLGTPA